MKINNRNVALDLVRVIACLLVMVQHSSEFYYIGDQGSLKSLKAYLNYLGVLEFGMIGFSFSKSSSHTINPIYEPFIYKDL